MPDGLTQKNPWHVENLRRRVAGRGPIDPSTPLPPAPTYESKKKSSRRRRPIRVAPGSEQDTEDDNDSSSLDSSDSDVEVNSPTLFIAEQCLFCNKTSTTLDDNLAHMHTTHGLFVVNPEGLIVDHETLLRYFHLVIFEYRECLYCHSQRRTVQAAQQHMLDKGHCKFDIESPDSEYRDFYDFTSSTFDAKASNLGQEFAHLPSGKVVISRTASQVPQARQHIPRDAPEPSTQPNASFLQRSEGTTRPAASSSLSLTTRVERREDLLASQLSRLSTSDRASLAHLPSSQQLALLATQQKQAEAEKRREKRLRTRVTFVDQTTVPKAISNGLPWTDSRYPGR